VTWRNRWTRFGFRAAICELVFDALARAIHLHVFLINRHPHTASQDVPPDDIRTFEFRALTPDEVRRFAHDRGLQMTPAFAESSLARRDHCFGVLQGDRLVAYDWRGLHLPVPLNDDLDVHYALPGQVYGYAMFTRPEFRGLRLQLHNLRHADTHLLAEGHTHTIGYVALQNLASIRNLSRIRGQEFVGVAGYMRVWGRYLTFRTPEVRRCGFRLQRSPRDT
jgi:hypothetical protein